MGNVLAVVIGASFAPDLAQLLCSWADRVQARGARGPAVVGSRVKRPLRESSRNRIVNLRPNVYEFHSSPLKLQSEKLFKFSGEQYPNNFTKEDEHGRISSSVVERSLRARSAWGYAVRGARFQCGDRRVAGSIRAPRDERHRLSLRPADGSWGAVDSSVQGAAERLYARHRWRPCVVWLCHGDHMRQVRSFAVAGGAAGDLRGTRCRSTSSP